MRKKEFKKVLAAVLAVGMAAGLSACGGGETASETTAAAEAAAPEAAAPEAQEETVGEAGGQWKVWWPRKERRLRSLIGRAPLPIRQPGMSFSPIFRRIIRKSRLFPRRIRRVISGDAGYPSAGDDWPDVIRYTYQRLGKFKAADVMLDLTPYISQESLDDVSDAFLSAGTYDGKVVAMPHHADTIAIYYNKRMFEEAGIRIPTSVEDAWTWEELTDIARTLKEQFNLPYACGGIWEGGSGYRYLPFVYMNGGALLNEDQTAVTMNSPEVLEAIQFYENLRKEDLICNTALTGTATTNSLFVAEQIAFTFSGSWHCFLHGREYGWKLGSYLYADPEWKDRFRYGRKCHLCLCGNGVPQCGSHCS